MSWLVTGGAGYIGTHVVDRMQAAGHEVVVLDDLSTGDAARVGDAPLVEGSILDGGLVASVLRRHGVRGVVHVAGKKQAGESVEQPLHYWRENVAGMVSLLEACREAGVEQFVFSSSCSVYGMPDADLVTERTPRAPMSPYGETKLAGEQVLAACASAYGIRSAVLRYFNVAGAERPERGDVGVYNLIPMVFERLDAGLRPRVFGADYDTPDGTCIRDYVHVADIARAHVLCAEALDAGSGSTVYNIGRGHGSSVLEVLEVIGETTGEDVSPEVVARRPGDPARIVGSAELARRELGFVAQHDLRSMVESAWAGWRLQHPR